MDEVSYYKEQAKRCRRLADMTHIAEVTKLLLELAEEFDRKALTLAASATRQHEDRQR